MSARHHLLIAGTGRAGTSFLVRFFHELGLETHIGKRGESAHWDENANAGYEDHVLWKSETLPYVAKFPWLFESIDAVLSDRSIVIDGVIVPIRDLHDAASSRVVLEMRNRYASLPQLHNEDNVWEHWAATPGGVIYSLNPIDEARILATGFHRLIERLVAAEVPIYMLAFPRMVEDSDHLLRQLRGCLPADLGDEHIREAHSRVADISKVRVGRESKAEDQSESLLETLDRQALGREILRLRAELAKVKAKLSATGQGEPQ